MTSISAKTLQLLQTQVQPWVDKLPWQATHPVRFDESEGYEGNGVMGARAGPMDAIDFENVAHEMAHAIEIFECGRPQALARPNWGLHIKTSFQIGGRTVHEPSTMQATERETTVCGIQLRILEMVGHPLAKGFVRRHATTLLHWMPDNIFGGDNDKQRIATRERLIRDAYQQWPAARVGAAWRAVQPLLLAISKPEIVEAAQATPRRRAMGY